MTDLPPPSKKKLGLVIDLDTCVGCHACAVSCKQWNAGGIAGPLTDEQPYGKDPSGVWFNRVHSYEIAATSACASTGSIAAEAAQPAMTLHFPRSCLHCETPACVTVCPTGASYKRAEDGIVLVDEDKCIGCKLCSWACPYGAREYSAVEGVMKKCTLCVDRIYNEQLPEADRQPACVQACPTRAP
jgi:sulfite dehydrogenase (quinone) subunit SoeB